VPNAFATPSCRSTSPAKVSRPSTIHGRRQIGTTAVSRGAEPSYVDAQARRAAVSHGGSGSSPQAASIRRRLANAAASVAGAVTQTGMPSARSAATSSGRFSSALASTRSGSAARTSARSGYFEPPTRCTARPAGWVQ
jgi:hypothetical protein